MDVALASRSIRVLPLATGIGLAAWVSLLIVLPAPLAARIFLAAPLVVVPLLLARLSDRPIVGRLSTRMLAPGLALAGALFLAAALALPPGPVAAALALPWIGVTAVAGGAALVHGLANLRWLFLPARVAALATDAALGFLAIGGLFLAADRTGVAVLGYGPPYTLLGAIHYHFAGFGLLALVALLATERPMRRGWLAALALIGGVVVTALGLIVSSALVNWLAVIGLAAGGMLLAWLLADAARVREGGRRLALVVAAGALAVGLAMGVLWASATLFGFAFIGMELMVRTHGTLNAGAVLLAALVLALHEGVLGLARSVPQRR